MKSKAMGCSPLIIAAVVGILFGITTIASGGRALFGGPEAAAAVGNAVPFVLWFNFLAGFAYVITGGGLILRKRWAIWFSATIALATVGIFAAFGLHIVKGGTFEMRTVGAMSIRTFVWLVITGIAWTRIPRSE